MRLRFTYAASTQGSVWKRTHSAWEGKHIGISQSLGPVPLTGGPGEPWLVPVAAPLGPGDVLLPGRKGGSNWWVWWTRQVSSQDRPPGFPAWGARALPAPEASGGGAGLRRRSDCARFNGDTASHHSSREGVGTLAEEHPGVGPSLDSHGTWYPGPSGSECGWRSAWAPEPGILGESWPGLTI